MADLSSWLPLIGPFTVQEEGTDLPRRGTIDFVGTGVSVEDDPDNEKTTITIATGLSVAGSSGDLQRNNGGGELSAAGVNDDGTTLTVSRTSARATGNARFKAYEDIANLRTVDATTQNLYTWTITDECATQLIVQIMAIKSDGTATAAYTRRVRIKSDGAVVTVGSVEDNLTDEDGITATITIDNSGSTGRVRVNSGAAITVDWGCVVTRLEMTHA